MLIFRKAIVFFSETSIIQYSVSNYSHQLYSKTSDLLHLIAESVYPFTNLSLFSTPLIPGTLLMYLE